MASKVIRTVFLSLVVSLALPFGVPVLGAVFSHTATASEKQKIEALIQLVGNLKDVKLGRNGSAYEAASAVQFLRGKWKANDAQVTTAGDFIDKIASVSGTSGKPYLLRFKDGTEVTSRTFLSAELKKLDASL